MSWKRKLEKSWGRLGMKYKLSDICDIKIGRTPPRKESQWFNTGLYSDYTWVSIKDLGECNKYIDFSSETISLDGQEKFNIPIVKTGTILLSFKLTVGRVAIATKNLLTNEAIAQLPIKDSSKVDRDFLYYYLLRYPWSTLGSTSSIATAINSKLIKEMEVELPDILMQRKIANILSTFDEKINTNYDTNNNLPPHPCNARIAAKQRRQTPKTDECLHTDGKVSDRGCNEETAEQFLSILAA